MPGSGRRRILTALAAVLAVATPGLVGACTGAGDGLTLVAYTTPREVYEEVIPAFRDTPAGDGVQVFQSYGPSGDQSRIVESGLPADVVALALEPDITRLVDAGLVDPGWDDGPTRGMVSTSVVALAVREGNPKGVRGWDDLLRDDIEVITPNPFTSGGAQWNVAAAYGQRLARGGTHEDGLRYLERLFANVSVQPKGSREALQVFRAGKGDVLIAYENEAITARAKGEPLDYVIPPETILIENPIAVTTDSARPDQARAFVRYLLGPDAQRAFARLGYRSVRPEVVAEHAARYPTPPRLFTMDGELGGWQRFRGEFFAPDGGHLAEILAGRDPAAAR